MCVILVICFLFSPFIWYNDRGVILIKKNFNAIDLVKFIFSILVIVVHTYPFFETHSNVNFVFSNILGRLVIPFYFIAAGYFLEKGNSSKSEDYFKRYMKRLIKLYLLWSLICLPAGLFLINNLMELNLLVATGGIFVGILYAGTYYHLWYMAALIFSIYVSHIILKRFRLKHLLIVAGILYGFGLCETYYSLIELLGFSNFIDPYFGLFVTTRNGIFFGLLFVTLGIAIGRYDYNLKIKHPLRWTIVFLFGLFAEASIVRYFNFAIDYNMYILNLPLMFMFFNWLLNVNLTWPLNYKTLRVYSTTIYFAHGMFLEYIPLLLSLMNLGYWSSGPFRFVSVLTLTLLTSWIVIKYIPSLK